MNGREFRTAEIFFKDELAGTLWETSEGYQFVYDKNFLKKQTPLSFSLPLQEEPFASKELFPFFSGLLPEGWYLDLVRAVCKIDPDDKFGLLLNTAGTDTIGAVTVRPT